MAYSLSQITHLNSFWCCKIWPFLLDFSKNLFKLLKMDRHLTVKDTFLVIVCACCPNKTIIKTNTFFKNPLSELTRLNTFQFGHFGYRAFLTWTFSSFLTDAMTLKMQDWKKWLSLAIRKNVIEKQKRLGRSWLDQRLEKAQSTKNFKCNECNEDSCNGLIDSGAS